MAGGKTVDHPGADRIDPPDIAEIDARNRPRDAIESFGQRTDGTQQQIAGKAQRSAAILLEVR